MHTHLIVTPKTFVGASSQKPLKGALAIRRHVVRDLAIDVGSCTPVNDTLSVGESPTVSVARSEGGDSDGGDHVVVKISAIDLCVASDSHVGSKTSSAYVPPEMVYRDEATDIVRLKAPGGEVGVSSLLAHPSFDVWALACILYQMCHPDVRPLFQATNDDTLGLDPSGDCLTSLLEWTDLTKQEKLAQITDDKARNLLAQMLTKDPEKRPSLARVLTHPFLSKKEGMRMVGDQPTYDVFISYRVATEKVCTPIVHLPVSVSFPLY
jgi:serine/threonine protein kinase